jgi:hypothetical protein
MREKLSGERSLLRGREGHVLRPNAPLADGTLEDGTTLSASPTRAKPLGVHSLLEQAVFRKRGKGEVRAEPTRAAHPVVETGDGLGNALPGARA